MRAGAEPRIDIARRPVQGLHRSFGQRFSMSPGCVQPPATPQSEAGDQIGKVELAQRAKKKPGKPQEMLLGFNQPAKVSHGMSEQQ